MESDVDRCARAKQLRRIDDAFRHGDLEALRAAVDDPALVPNGPMPITVGACLVAAIYHSPLAFIRTLLELGANPNAPTDDGFPPIIAALTCARTGRGMPARSDVDEIIRLLLSFGADPNQRGINDWTPLHMAVAERNEAAIRILLDAGADRTLRTRIDEYDTALESAESAGLASIAAILRTYAVRR
jgi:ankyrin repeat protein